MQQNIHTYPKHTTLGDNKRQSEVSSVAMKKCKEGVLGLINTSDFLEKIIIKIAEKYNHETLEIQKTVINLINILDYKFKKAQLDDGNYMVCCNIIYKLINKEEFIKNHNENNNLKLLENLETYIIQGAIHDNVHLINHEIKNILEQSGLENTIQDKETSFLQFVFFAKNDHKEKQEKLFLENMQSRIEHLKQKPEFNKRKYLKIGLSKAGTIYETKKMNDAWQEKINSLLDLLEKPEELKNRLKISKNINKGKTLGELFDIIIALKSFENDGLYVD